MQNAADGGASAASDGPNNGYHAIVSDLVSLVAQLQSSIRLIESAMGRDAPLGNQEFATNVVVLDDVTPRYARANAALNAANAGLRAALHFLQDTRPSKHPTEDAAGRRPLRSIGRV
jgi:multidrug resistance efflux pump